MGEPGPSKARTRTPPLKLQTARQESSKSTNDASPHSSGIDIFSILHNYNIPPSYSNLNTIPMALPYIPVPGFPELCLTPFLDTDIPHLLALLNSKELFDEGVASAHPLVSIAGSEGITEKMVREYFLGGFKVGEQKTQWCFPAIRMISNLSRSDPGLLGYITLSPDRSYKYVQVGRWWNLQSKAKRLGDEEVHWLVEFALQGDEYENRTEVMKSALSYILESYFITFILPFPGQLSIATNPNNDLAEELLLVLDFEEMATVKTMWFEPLQKRVDIPSTIMSVWQGSGDCSQELHNCVYKKK